MAVNHAPGEGDVYPSPDESVDDLFDEPGDRTDCAEVVEDTPSSSRSARVTPRGEATQSSVLEESDLFGGVSDESGANLTLRDRTPASSKRITNVPVRKSNLYPNLGTSPSVQWTSAFLTPVSSDRSGQESFSRPRSDSSFERFTSPCEITPIRSIQRRIGVRSESPQVFRWESSGYRPATSRRPAFPEDLSPFKLDERMEDVRKTAFTEAKGETVMRPDAPVVPVVAGKENLAPPAADVGRGESSSCDWGEFDIGGSQEEAMAEHMEQFERALNANEDGKCKSDAVMDAEKVKSEETEDTLTVLPLPSRSFSSNLRAFFEGDDDPDLEAGLLSAVCEAEEKELRKGRTDDEENGETVHVAKTTDASSQIPKLPVEFTGGFKTLTGQTLGVMSTEARERAKKLWTTCETDEPPVDADPLVPSVPATMTKSEVRNSALPASPSRSVCGFRTLAGVPLTCSQATYKEYTRFYQSDLDVVDEEGVNRAPSPEPPVEKGGAMRLTRSSLAKHQTPPVAPTSPPEAKPSAPPPFLAQNPKLAKAAKLFEDIDGFGDLLSQDHAPTVTPAQSKGAAVPSSLRTKATPSFAAFPSTPAVAASTPTPPQLGSKKKPLFESLAAECKDLNFGFLKNLNSGQKSALSRTPVARPSSSGLSRATPANSRSLLQGGSECSSTPRGLFRSAFRAPKIVLENKSTVRDGKTSSQESSGSDAGEEKPEYPTSPRRLTPAQGRAAPPVRTSPSGESKPVEVGLGVKRVMSTGSDGMDDDFEPSEEFLQQLQQLEEQNALGDTDRKSPQLEQNESSGMKRKFENGLKQGPAKKSRGPSQTHSQSSQGTAATASELSCDTLPPAGNAEARANEPDTIVMSSEEGISKDTGESSPQRTSLGTSGETYESNDGMPSGKNDSTADGSSDGTIDFSLINCPPSPVVSTRRSIQPQRSPVIERKVRASQVREEAERAVGSSEEPGGSEEGVSTEDDGQPVAASPIVKRRRSKRSLGRKRKSIVKH